jgi:uncharacterized protein
VAKGEHVPVKALCLYHANCPDGFTAAWVVASVYGANVTLIPVRYGEPVPPIPEGTSKVLIVDFCYPRAELDALAARVPVVVLDHHKTSEPELDGFAESTWHREKSGARLAWEYFFRAGKTPRLVDYVEDRDLWRFALPDSRAISQWLRMYPYSLEQWDEAYHLLEDDVTFAQAVQLGQGLLRFQDTQVRSMVDRCFWVEIGGWAVPTANATVFFSEVGEGMCLDNPSAPFSAYYLDREDGSRQWGLRSRGGFDVSEVAKAYGGGGHAGAAGFVTERGFMFPSATKPEVRQFPVAAAQEA